MAENTKNITVNRKARHDYHIHQTYEAGIELFGTEVKALRQNKAHLTDGYASVKGGEAWLMNAHIGIYEQGNINNHEPERKRKLLLHKNEIRKLEKATQEKGYTLVPMRLYFKEGKVKAEIALASGKKVFDKRQTLQEKQTKREIDRKLKDLR